MATKQTALVLAEGDEELLNGIADSPMWPPVQARKARCLLGLAGGDDPVRIAGELGCQPRTASVTRSRA